MIFRQLMVYWLRIIQKTIQPTRYGLILILPIKSPKDGASMGRLEQKPFTLNHGIKFIQVLEGSYSIPKFIFKKLYYDEEVYAGLTFITLLMTVVRT